MKLCELKSFFIFVPSPNSHNRVNRCDENSQLLIEDAMNAGLNIKCFSDISMLDVFPKNN